MICANHREPCHGCGRMCRMGELDGKPPKGANPETCNCSSR